MPTGIPIQCNFIRYNTRRDDTIEQIYNWFGIEQNYRKKTRYFQKAVNVNLVSLTLKYNE